VRIEAPVVDIADGTLIGTRTQGAGSGGGISIIASKRVTLSGTGPTGRPNRLDASTIAEGRAGDIVIRAPVIELRDGAALRTEGIGVGDARAIQLLAAESISLSGRSGGEPARISSGSSQGRAGSIRIDAARLELLDGAEIVTTSLDGEGGTISLDGVNVNLNGGFLFAETLGSGAGGDVNVRAEQLNLSGASISTAALGAGDGGEVQLQTGNLRMSDGAAISARSFGPGDAGSLRLTASDSLVLAHSGLVTNATTGSGGNIELRAPGRIDLLGTVVTASVGAGEGGSVLIDPQLLLLEDSLVSARAAKLGGRGGRIEVSADLVLATRDGQPVPLSEVFDASAPGGPEFSGSVEIHSPDVDLAGTLTALAGSFLDASSLLSERCAARGGASSGSFVARGRSGVPGGPEDLLPAYGALGGPGASASRAGGPRSLALLSVGSEGCR
jgi:hypothetical protein